MPTTAGTIEERQITLIVLVAPLGIAEGSAEAHASIRSFRALLDTGAQGTLISPNVVAKVGLVPTGFKEIVPASGETITVLKYRAGIGIPISEGAGRDIRGAELDVAELPYQPPDYDVLLGMDFLTNLHVTIYGGKFVLST